MMEKEVTIAVLPFRNLSLKPETEYFANGFAEDLTRELTRFPSLRVLAAQSTFGLPLADQSVERLSANWRLDFILQGTIRWGDATLRVGVQLIRAEGGEIVWAERIDTALEKVFAVQDEIVAAVAGRLAVHLDEMRLEAARRRTSENLEAYECWLRGMDCLKRSTLESDEESRQYFMQALEIHPEYARAYSGLSLSHFNEWTCQAWHLWDESGPLAFDYAQKAVEIDTSDAMAHSVLARVFRFRYQHEEADRHAEIALTLNPNDAHVLIQVAVTKLFGGEFDEGFRLACKAKELNPLHPGWYLGIIGWNLFMLRRYDEAFDYLSKAGESIVELPAYRAACVAINGDLPRAGLEYEIFIREYRNKIAFGREPEPGEPLRWVAQVEPFRNIEHSRRLQDALRNAGIAEIDVDAAIHSRMDLKVRPANIACPPGNSFTHEGTIWSVAYGGAGAKLVELKGFHDIARLLAQPYEPIPCQELSSSPQESGAPYEVLDKEARRDYKRRIEELQREIEKAKSDNDLGRSGPARQELDILIDELVKATGLGGRSRKMAHSAERARTAVTWRIHSAIKKIGAAHPRMGKHLSNSIHTGYFCVYSPESACSWEL